MRQDQNGVRPEPGDDSIEIRAEHLGAMLRDSIRSLYEAVGGPGCSATDLSRVCGIDKTMAWRLVRAGKASSPIESILAAPKLKGLRQTVESVRGRSVVPDEVVDSLSAACDAYGQLVDSVSGGASYLEVMLGGSSGSDMSRQMRHAQKQIHRHMAMLQGATVRRHEVQTWYAPTEDDPAMADYFWSSAMVGLQRLRESGALYLGGAYDPEEPGVEQRRLNIDGRLADSDIKRWLVEDMSTIDSSAVHVWWDPPARMMLLPPGSIELLTPHRTVMASRTPAGLPRRATADSRFAHSMVTSRLPAEDLVVDVLVDRRLGFGRPGCRPVLSMLPMGVYLSEPDVDVPAMSDIEFDLQHLGGGDEAVGGMSETGRAIAERMQRSSGWDPAGFDAWRLRVGCPVPMVTMHMWFPKPE
ncbi:MAG: hypothetical protein AAGF47_04290 [Planctomycetota bacterium]